LFSLIITILSIGLVALFALVSINYLQHILSGASSGTAATLIIAQASQIAGANRVYAATQGNNSATVEDLVNSNLLKSVPVPPFKDGGQYTFTPARAVRLSVTSETLCAEIQKKLFNSTTISSIKPENHGCYNSDGAYVFILQG
jgi:hypothetical protein